jgi:hypothetical protein
MFLTGFAHVRIVMRDREPGDDARGQCQRCYLAHPDAIYFKASRIGNDQVADWARRTGLDEGEARRALAAAL